MIKKQILTSHIATRQRSVDFFGLWNILPDPDPVLRKRGNDITVYKDLLSDPHLWACVQSFKSGIMSKEYEIIKPEQAGGKRLSNKAHDLVVNVFKDLDIQRIISEILDAFLFGLSPLEVIWSNDYKITDIVGKPVEWFIYSPENECRFLAFDSQLYGEPLPPYKFLLPRYFPTYENPYGQRLLSKCFWSVTFKRGGMKFWNIFTEKYGMPFLIGKVPSVASEAERATLLTNLESMVMDSVAVINDDEAIDMPHVTSGTASVAIYSDLINFCNIEISKAILGQNLSTEMTSGGSYAAMKGALTVRDDIIQMGEKLVCQTLNQVIQWLCNFHFGETAYPEFNFYQEEDSQKELAERDKILSEAGLKFGKEYWKKAYNFDDDDFEIADPASAEPPPEKPEPAEFAEGSFDLIDSISGNAAVKTVPAIDKMLAPLMRRIGKAKSYQEIAELLYSWYPEADISAFQEMLSRALTFTSLIGAEEVSNE